MPSGIGGRDGNVKVGQLELSLGLYPVSATVAVSCAKHVDTPPVTVGRVPHRV